MPANLQKPAAATPASPRNTAKYANKDGSKFIQVPKGAVSEPAQPTTPTASKNADSSTPLVASESPAPAVNRKKQKRREKAAAKAAAEQSTNGHSGAVPATSTSSGHGPVDDDEGDSEAEDNDHCLLGSGNTNGHSGPSSKKNKKKKKKKAAGVGSGHPPQLNNGADASASHLSPPLSIQRGSGMSRDKIWSTSSQEERERIKEFWLGLGEGDRKSLVKVEKDAVLKKMKEQQKHTCSCTVCGRKRTAIEEELEGLYDAYYLELEQFANHGEGPPMLSPPRDYPGRPYHGIRQPYQTPSSARIVDHEEDGDELEDGFSEGEVDDEEYSDEEPPEAYHESHDHDVADFLTFGNSLQVKGTQLLDSLLRRYGNMDLGGILTVADDLLKNDGKRFIEMMEQLAERRMAREEDAREHFAGGYSHQNPSYSNDHEPLPEEDDYEDEDEDDEVYEDDSQEEDYDDEEDPLSDEQRMEEGRRMFQIFAARMFEQRVLSAYKEKVAKERQARLIEELEEEDRKHEDQKAKKAKTAQKKKEKAAQKKQALAEEKARKEAEKAAEEAARQEAERQRLAEQRQRADEKKRQKEAQKKAEEEARLKKEAEKQRRIHEQREKQAEAERKAREAKEREKKLKEEQRMKEKEAREQKEREALERKEKQERDKREKEARAAKAQKEAQEAKEAREKAKEEKAREELATKAAAQAQAVQAIEMAKAQKAAKAAQVAEAVEAAKAQRAADTSQAAQTNNQPTISSTTAKPSQQPPASLPTVPPQHPSNPASFVSPKVPVATPVMSKAPTPMRPRTVSQHEMMHSHPIPSLATSQSGSGSSQNPSPHPESAMLSSPRYTNQNRRESSSMSGSFAPFPFAAQASSPQRSLPNRPSVSTPVQGGLSMNMQPPGLAHHPMPPGFPARMGHEGNVSLGGFRNMAVPPPGIDAPTSRRNNSINRGFSPAPPPGFNHSPLDPFPINQGFQRHSDAQSPLATHPRQGSVSLDMAPGTPAQPIVKPAPIGAPIGTPIGRSISRSQGQARTQSDHDEEAEQHLGSRALLDDDEPLVPDVNSGILRTQPPGPRPAAFGTGSFMDPGFPIAHNPWGSPNHGGLGFSLPTLGHWGAPNMGSSFNGIGSPSPMSAARPSLASGHAVRSILVNSYRHLANNGMVDGEGYLSLQTLKLHIDSSYRELNLSNQELLDLLETEGNLTNGGGIFELKVVRGAPCARWLAATNEDMRPLGHIASPMSGPAGLSGM